MGWPHAVAPALNRIQAAIGVCSRRRQKQPDTST
ncbi:predicted protein [Plenodomus lingam JN3]|uniref:Predicted protein n=1 Tax=Leptosphaeria maculans (strain JN3 / isolate v23.1.3 / race Av1-4-5-6-7-8) TaxID=985895 RepID=E5A2M2_LEPMJ|nr:predicted protein [Plenodomus lingam JN3]CBX97818.1 predicted protein [Plenodomus lingam JN3]